MLSKSQKQSFSDSAAENYQISIVIAAWNRLDYLHECLKSLVDQVEAETEVIIVSNLQDGIDESKKLFPFAKFILLPKATVPELRTAGIFAANKAIIALLEDHCTFDSQWLAEIKQAHQLPFGIVGGTVENASPENALNWAVFFYDYGNYMSPVQAGATTTLSGMNVSYKRETLLQVSKTYANGFFETFVNENLKNLGHKLYLAPSAVVYHRKNYNFKLVANQFFHQARSFAAGRVAGLPPARRAPFILISIVLPFLLTVRTISRALEKKRYAGKLILAFPYLLILLTIWATGEFCGYSFGAGKSARHWR